jgi:hypothetical protein
MIVFRNVPNREEIIQVFRFDVWDESGEKEYTR